MDVKRFYIKRAVAILPLYYFSVALFVLFRGEETIVQNIMIFPMEILGLQSAFPNTFGISHNGGTWFVSVILIAYVLFPFLREIIIRIHNEKMLISLITVLMALVIYFPFMAHAFHLGTLYSNPFMRLMEFIIGMMIAHIIKQRNTMIKKPVIYFGAVLIVTVLFCGVDCIYRFGVGDYLLYNVVAIPCFAGLLALLSKMDTKNNRLVSYLSSLSYAFFMAQLFIWTIMIQIEKHIDLSNNIMRIIASFIVCFLMAVILHEGIEKPTKGLLMKGIKK